MFQKYEQAEKVDKEGRTRQKVSVKRRKCGTSKTVREVLSMLETSTYAEVVNNIHQMIDHSKLEPATRLMYDADTPSSDSPHIPHIL